MSTNPVTAPTDLREDGSWPFGTGPIFEVDVPADVLTIAGNVSVPAGRYEARQDDGYGSQEGTIVLWSARGYIAGGIWTSIPAWDWTFPGEPQRPIPEHDCTDVDNLRTSVCADDPTLYCSICLTAVC